MDTNVSKIEVFQGENDEWYWRGKSANGEIVANSAPESYTRREDAKRAANDTFPGVPVLLENGQDQTGSSRDVG